jgi:hypothetical protein
LKGNEMPGFMTEFAEETPEEKKKKKVPSKVGVPQSDLGRAMARMNWLKRAASGAKGTVPKAMMDVDDATKALIKKDLSTFTPAQIRILQEIKHSIKQVDRFLTFALEEIDEFHKEGYTDKEKRARRKALVGGKKAPGQAENP